MVAELLREAPLFWGLAVCCVLVALGFVLPPLLRAAPGRRDVGRDSVNLAVYRDQLRELGADRERGLLDAGQYAAAVEDIEARIAQDALAAEPVPSVARRGFRGLAAGLALALPAAVFAGYALLGNPAALLESAQDRTVPQHAGAEGHDFTQLLAQVQGRVEADPSDVTSWILLGKTYATLGRWADAATAYERASGLQPDNATLLAHLAEVLAIQADREFAGRPMALIRKALELDPQEAKALELAGVNAYQERNYSKAAYYWKQLLKVLPEGDPYAEDIRGAMTDARRLAEEAAFGMPPAPEPAGPVAKGSEASIAGRVELAPALRARVEPRDTVFLFARAAGGSAPLAALRISADKLPATFLLDDSLAMGENARLSGHAEVTLTARVSKSGSPEPRAGDLEGTLRAVKVGRQDVALVIDTIR